MSKPTVLKKTAVILSIVMMMSLLLPILAFAGEGYNTLTYKDGKVTGSVYTDAYGSFNNSESITINVYDQNKTFLKSITSNTYTDNNSGERVFSFTNQDVGVTAGVYIGFQYETATGIVYGPYSPYYTHQKTDTSYPGGGFGGGGGYIGSTIEVTNGKVSEYDLKSAFSNNTVVTLNVKGDTVEIPVAGLIDALKNDAATLIIKTENGTYELPLTAVDFTALAKQVGSEVKDLTLTVGVKKLADDAADPVLKAIAALDGTALSAVVDYTMSIAGKDGKKVAVTDFEKYVKRTLPLSKTSSDTKTIVMYNTDTKALSFVPARFTDKEAAFFRAGNSIYAAASFDKTFADVASHWAKADINLLASKLIVDGVTDTAFEPERNITRAEFAALIVRSLGLNQATSSTFNDVKASDWFAGVVGAAAKAGIVDGYEDGSFRPQAQITREELAAMVVRAYEFAGGSVAISDESIESTLSKWADADKIVWGDREVAVAITTGLVDGMTDTTLQTDAQATRAQSATMLKRFLSKVEFID